MTPNCWCQRPIMQTTQNVLFLKACPVFLIPGGPTCCFKHEPFITSNFNIKLCCCCWETFRVTALRKRAKPSCSALMNNIENHLAKAFRQAVKLLSNLFLFKQSLRISSSPYFAGYTEKHLHLYTSDKLQPLPCSTKWTHTCAITQDITNCKIFSVS